MFTILQIPFQTKNKKTLAKRLKASEQALQGVNNRLPQTFQDNHPDQQIVDTTIGENPHIMGIAIKRVEAPKGGDSHFMRIPQKVESADFTDDTTSNKEEPHFIGIFQEEPNQQPVDTTIAEIPKLMGIQRKADKAEHQQKRVYNTINENPHFMRNQRKVENTEYTNGFTDDTLGCEKVQRVFTYNLYLDENHSNESDEANYNSKEVWTKCRRYITERKIDL